MLAKGACCFAGGAPRGRLQAAQDGERGHRCRRRARGLDRSEAGEAVHQFVARAAIVETVTGLGVVSELDDPGRF